MKRTVISAAVLALAIAGVGVASAEPSMYKVTGGGQIIDTATQSGAGDQISFTAQSLGAEEADGSNAKGQFTYHNRVQDSDGKGTGKGQETIHGEVTCVVVYDPAGDSEADGDGPGGIAVVGGYTRDDRPFRIDVFDDGQGKDSADMLRLSFDEAAQDGSDDDDGLPLTEDDDQSLCDEEDETVDAKLGRGNVKIHKVRADS